MGGMVIHWELCKRLLSVNQYTVDNCLFFLWSGGRNRWDVNPLGIMQEI